MTDYYTSGEFAKRAHVSVRTIRYYDQQNLLKPSARSKGGARRYSDADFAKLQQILLLKYLGFSLGEIRGLTLGASDRRRLLDSLQNFFHKRCFRTLQDHADLNIISAHGESTAQLIRLIPHLISDGTDPLSNLRTDPAPVI